MDKEEFLDTDSVSKANTQDDKVYEEIKKLLEQEKKIESRLINDYPAEYKIVKEIMSSYKKFDKKYPEVEHLNELVSIIKKYDFYDLHNTYQIDNLYYNADEIYKDYKKSISSNDNDFIDDLIFLFFQDMITIFIPQQSTKSFTIPSTFHPLKSGIDELFFSETICELLRGIKNGKIAINSIISLSYHGKNYATENVPYYLINKALKEQETLRRMQESLKHKMDSFLKEIISVVALILTIVPFVVINISQLQQFNVNRLLVVNGCLLSVITLIIFSINLSFFNLKKNHWWLLVPIIIGSGLIILGCSINLA